MNSREVEDRENENDGDRADERVLRTFLKKDPADRIPQITL